MKDEDDYERKKREKKEAAAEEKRRADLERKNKWNMLYKLSIPEQLFCTKVLHRQLMGEAVRLMVLYFGHYSYSIAFPEIAFPTVLFLKEFTQNTSIDADLRGMARMLSSKLKENSSWITSKRKSVEFSPKDFNKVHQFLATEKQDGSSPLSRFVKTTAFKSIMEYKEKDDVDHAALKKEAEKKRKRLKLEAKRAKKREAEKEKVAEKKRTKEA